MNFIGFNFTKVSVERFSSMRTGAKIQTNVDIKDVTQAKADFMNSKESILEVKFSYNIKYDPKIADILFEGTIIVSASPKESRDILKSWKKQDLPEEFKMQVINIVMRKSSIKALVFEDEMNLPLHLPLPTFRKQEKEKQD